MLSKKSKPSGIVYKDFLFIRRKAAGIFTGILLENKGISRKRRLGCSFLSSRRRILGDAVDYQTFENTRKTNNLPLSETCEIFKILPVTWFKSRFSVTHRSLNERKTQQSIQALVTMKRFHAHLSLITLATVQTSKCDVVNLCMDKYIMTYTANFLFFLTNNNYYENQFNITLYWLLYKLLYASAGNSKFSKENHDFLATVKAILWHQRARRKVSGFVERRELMSRY